MKRDDQVQQSGSFAGMGKATAPLDLLRELRTGFEAEAKHFRELEKTRAAKGSRAVGAGGARAAGAKAYAAEQAVQKIDATLRDWA